MHLTTFEIPRAKGCWRQECATLTPSVFSTVARTGQAPDYGLGPQPPMWNRKRAPSPSLAKRRNVLPSVPGESSWQSFNARYIRAVFERRNAAVGRQYGLDYAEQFHYIAPDPALDEYVAGRAVPL